MSEEKVLITGANGFIGSHLVEKFLNQGCRVYGLVRKTSDLSLLKGIDIPLRYGDITDAESVMKALYGIDVVIHNAGLASDWGSLDLFRKINLQGTMNVAQASKLNGVRRIVYISSTAIHGFNHNHPACEDDPKKPVFNYGISKLEAENSLFRFCRENSMEVTAIRPGNVFGPRDHTFIEKYIKAMISGKIAYVNNGESLTCPTYIENLVHGIYLASFHDNAPGEAFIITDGQHISWKQFTESLAAELGISGPALSVPLASGLFGAAMVERLYLLLRLKKAPLITRYRLYNGGTDYYFSIEKARKLLGFKPVCNSQTAIEKTVKWFKKKHG